MLRKTAPIILDLLIILLLLGFILSVICLFTGSLEQFPTDEQMEKARIGAAVMTLLTGLPCAVCIYLRIRGRKKR